MNTKKQIWLFIILTGISLGVSIISCTKDKTPMPVEPCDPNKVYFQNSIMPLINSNCAKSGCHDAITQKEELNLTSYAGVMKIVRPGKPGSSKLIEAINAGGKEAMPPNTETPLTQEQKNLLIQWISDGALNSACAVDTSACDAAVGTYATNVSKVIGTNCLGCHSGANIKGGIDLSAYSGVKSAVTSGKLYNAISQNGSAIAMPPSPASKLSGCDIKKIKSWIDAGSLNN